MGPLNYRSITDLYMYYPRHSCDNLFTAVVAGRQMMVITDRKGDNHFNELPKYIESQVNM